MKPTALILIGRNESRNLPACLQSIRNSRHAEILDIIYVDSNSTDNSCEFARAFRAHVVQLDTSVPFTAARARNAGAKALFERHPEVQYIQFVDADTELNPDWLAHAAGYLDYHPRVAAACGRRRERHPHASVYNLLTDMEWNTPIGTAPEFGGDALIRADVFQKLNGYNPAFIAGEEPELAARMRLHNFQIARLNHEMTLHDIAIHKFSQWFRRTLRSGHAIGQLHHAHGRPPLLLYRQPFRSTLFWTLAVPLITILIALLTTPYMLLLIPAGYLLLAARITRYRLHRGDTPFTATLYGFFTTLGKFPQLLGILTYHKNRLIKKQTKLIEYKATPSTSRPESHFPIPN